MLLHDSSRALASPIQKLLAAAVIASLAVSLPAQLQFEELPGHGLPTDNAVTTCVALGDVDGDGDLDMVLGTSGPTNLLYINVGGGTFINPTTAPLPMDTDQTNDVAFGDVDGDGDLDIVFANGTQTPSGGEQNRLYLNDGTGAFTDATATRLPAATDNTESVALGDVDGDGDLDLLIGNEGYVYTSQPYSWSFGEQNRLYLNDGTGTFSDVTATQMPFDGDSTRAVELGDVDGDGDLDIVAGNTHLATSYLSTQDRLYVNDGTGTFADVTATQLPVDTIQTRAAALGDVDGDGDLDLVLGNNGQSRLYVNDGAGTFASATAAQLPANSDNTKAVELGDADGDGDLDLVLGNNGQNVLYVNDGSGTFSDVTGARMPVATDNTEAIAFVDVDVDGDLDLTSANNGQQNLLDRNLLRHLDTPLPFKIGQTFTIDAYLRYGPPSMSDLALPYASFAPASVPTPPFGTIGIEPSTIVALPAITIPQPAGVGSISFPAPSLASFIGITLYSQAVVLDSVQARLSNVTSDEFEPLTPPTISGISPPSAAAGVVVNINGSNFLNGVSLKVGGNPTPINNWTANSILFTMPPGHGCDTAIEVANLGNSTATSLINGTPMVTSLTNTSGPAAGGTLFVALGHNLKGVTVTFNGVPMVVQTSVPTAVVGYTPPGMPGAAMVVISNAVGCQTSVIFTYQ